MSKSNRISIPSNGRFVTGQKNWNRSRQSQKEQITTVNPIRNFVVQRPATALLTGIAIGGVIGWLLTRIK